MKSQVVLITGALAGIGKATALAFARKGAKLVISGRKQEVGELFANELSQLTSHAKFIQADIRYEDQVQSLIEKTIKYFGRLDVAVNNAGTEGQIAPLVDTGLDNYQQTFDTNVQGVFLCLKYELKAMIPQGEGCIINLSSVAGKKGVPGASIYCSSKHAVEGLTKVAALEAAFANIRVNAVAPGPIETDMFERFTKTEEGKKGLVSSIPLQRAGHVDEVAETIVFLASDNASFITGQSIGVDGGFTA